MFGANELQQPRSCARSQGWMPILYFTKTMHLGPGDEDDNAQDSQDNGILKMNLDSYKAARGFVIYSNCLRKNLYER
jgi:hypothetical protein